MLTRSAISFLDVDSAYATLPQAKPHAKDSIRLGCSESAPVAAFVQAALGQRFTVSCSSLNHTARMRRLEDCEAGSAAPPGWVFAPTPDSFATVAPEPAQFVRGNLTLDARTVCRMTTGADWHGAARWRWLLFFALWPVCGGAGLVFGWLTSTLVIIRNGHVCATAPSSCDPLFSPCRALPMHAHQPHTMICKPRLPWPSTPRLKA